jgi:peptide/nickel transport system substrate-binding protein
MVIFGGTMMAISRRALVTRLGLGLAAGGTIPILAAQRAAAAPMAPMATASRARAAATAGTFNVAAWGDDVNPWLNPGNDWNPAFLYNRLLVWNFTFDGLEPDLAESWTLSDDQMEYTFNLRKDVKWHDGQPFTAADVEFSFQRLLDQRTASPRGTYLTALKGAADYASNKSDTLPGVTVVDDATIKLTLESPSGPFLSGLAALSILPKHVLGDVPADQLSKNDYFQTGFVGTGPFKLVNYVPDQSMELAANPDYFAGAPKLEKVVLQNITAPGAAILALEKGEVDFVMPITSDETEQVKAQPDLTVLGGPNFGFNGISLNLTHPSLADKRVHQAMLMAIDRQGIVDNIIHGDNKIVYQPIQTAWVRADDLNTYDYDPEHASPRHA